MSAQGPSDSEAARTTLRAGVAKRRRHASVAAEVTALAADQADREEMRIVCAQMHKLKLR